MQSLLGVLSPLWGSCAPGPQTASGPNALKTLFKALQLLIIFGKQKRRHLKSILLAAPSQLSRSHLCLTVRRRPNFRTSRLSEKAVLLLGILLYQKLLRYIYINIYIYEYLDFNSKEVLLPLGELCKICLAVPRSPSAAGLGHPEELLEHVIGQIGLSSMKKMLKRISTIYTSYIVYNT